MPRKERLNAKTWERDRRSRMNSYFKTLSDLLPPNQEGRKRKKVDILIYAAKYIKDLTDRTEELFYANAVDAHKEELNRLKKLVAQLHSRTQLLSALLTDAGITVPAEPALEKISPLKWSNKINVDDVDKYLDRYNECSKPEKRKSKSVGGRSPPKKKLPCVLPTVTPPSKPSTTIPSEDQENALASITPSAPSTSPPQNPSPMPPPPPKSVPITRKPDLRKKAKRKNSPPENFTDQSKQPEIIQPSKKSPLQNGPISNLIPGTLILSGGKIMPLMTPLPSNILVNTQPQSTNQILLTSQSNPMIVLPPIATRIQPVASVRSQSIVNTVQKVTLNTFPSIRANVGLNSQDWVSNVRTIVEATKIGGRKGILPKGKEITKTTMTYKVPIPAVHRDALASKNQESNIEKTEVKVKNRGKKGKKKCEKDMEKSADSKSEETRKRKNSGVPESSPSKTTKSSLPETCVAIENLRQVVEKIGEETPEKVLKASADQSDSAKDDEQPSTSVSKEKVSPEKPEDPSRIIETIAENSEVPPLPIVLEQNSKACTSTLDMVEEKSSPKTPEFLEDSSKVGLNGQDQQNPPLLEVDKVIAEAEVHMRDPKSQCDLGRFDTLLNPDNSQVEDSRLLESGKIILNLDTNTTTTMKQDHLTSSSQKDEKPKEPAKSLSFTSTNTFVPIRNEALHSDLSNDLFASLQVPSSSHNPESISPTAAFLMAFPLVSSLNGKTEVLEEDMKEDLKYHSQTPPMLLQIGTIEPTIFKAKINEDKCVTETEKKTECAPEQRPENQIAAPEKPEAPAVKPLPKIINNEPMKERHYKVVPYSEPMNVFSSPTTSQIITNVHSDGEAKKMQAPLEASAVTKIEDPSRELQKETMPMVTRATGVDPTPKYDRYPLPELASYSNFGDNQMAPNTTGYSPQVPAQPIYSSEIGKKKNNTIGDTCYSYGLEKAQARQPFVNRGTKIMNSNVPCTTTEDYQRNEMSLQYNYPRPKEPYQQNICQNYGSKDVPGPSVYQDYMSTKSSTNPQLPRAFVKETQNYQSYAPISQGNQTKQSLDFEFDSTRKTSFPPPPTAKLSKNQVASTQDGQRLEGTISFTKIPQDHRPANQVPSQDQFDSNYTTFDAKSTKRSEPQGYGVYREQKKMFENSNSEVKNQMPRYHQHQNLTNVTTSNYLQSTVTDSLAKSTTTVAHNSSTYSILSWTTLSPMGLGNNNNLGQFEGATDDDNNEGKAICEGFNYNQLHKETVGFGIMPEYSAEAIPIDKSKKIQETKQGYDEAKVKNIQPIQKQTRAPNSNQNQNQNPPQNQNPSMPDDFKFSENKTKPKYTMDSAYTQTEFGNLDQRHQKPHQLPQSKSEKTYAIPYDSQITFDLADPVPQTQGKCSDIYTGTNYKYDDKDHSQIPVKYQPLQSQPPLNDVTYNSAKPSHSMKSKIQQVQQPVRPPVNWMMTPEVKHNSHISDLILPPIGKELDFCQNNIFSQSASYNQSTSNQFYNNYDVSVSAGHSFPNVSTLQSDRFYPEDQPFTWSPTKNAQAGDHQTLKTLDQQVVPSTLPTLVGDLALGTNIPEKQSFLFSQMPRPNNDLPKGPVKEKDSNFQVMLNPQTVQTVQHNQGSFLSVSQLVEHEKAEKTHQQNHPTHHHTQQGQTRKQRKSNTSPRTPGKRQIEMRKDPMQQHDELKNHFPEQYQQQQKYQQNELWRNRNCKSNYTAESLIGVNTSIHDATDKQLHTPAIKFSADYSQSKFTGGLGTSEMVMPPINYLNADDGNGYGQVMNQNFNHTSYAYSPNTNIYPSANFISGISNSTSSYMMPLHDNPTDYLETNSFLLPNVSNVPPPKSVNTTTGSAATTRTSSVTAPANVKNQHFNNSGKQQQCDKRNSYPNVSKKSKRKSDASMQNLEFPIGGVTPMEDYHTHHTHATTFLPPPPHANPLYQNHTIPNSNRRGTSGTGNSIAMAHHPSGTSLTNFNLSTIFPEINDKVTGYKAPNAIQPGLSQSSNHSSTSYPQRANYPANNSLGHIVQVSESGQFPSDLPVPPPPSALHYKPT